MKATRITAPVIFIISMMTTLSVWSQDGDSSRSSPYAFGAACESQGAWTQSALAATQELRKITLNLRDDPNCKSLGTNLQATLVNLSGSIKEASDTDNTTKRMSQIPGELSALRNFAASSPADKKDVLRLMMDRSVEGATLSAKVGPPTFNTVMSNQLVDFGTRVAASTKTGMQLLDGVVSDLPKLNECLMGDGGQALGSYLSATVRIAASFASSGQEGAGTDLAKTISKLTTFARDKKFSKVLRKLNQQEFLSSMSCLMEVTSESYCQAREGMSLFRTGMKSLKVRTLPGKKASATNPYTGYYVLNTHVPNVTKWMQKIQVGVDPKLPTDADFQNKINQEVTDFFKSVKTLLGDYNSKVITVQTLPTLEQKQNAVLSLLLSVSERMTDGDGSFGRGGEKVNFFGMAKTTLKIPFYLIGMDGVPDQVAGKTMPQLTYKQWFAANISTIPAFKDPVALAETIRVNMNALIREANIATIEYFNRWYIVDKSALVNESLTDVNYTVKDSLKAIQEYLELAKQRIITYKGDASAVPIILDTQLRIKIILNAYADLEKLGDKWKTFKGTDLSKETALANAELYEKLINTVYEQFNVMTSKSGFLANRMVTFVYKDYDLLIKNSVDFTPFQKELFESQGMAAFDRMLQLYNGNPANMDSDLNMALTINSGNLAALELLLKDSLTGTIAELKMVSEGRRMLSDSVFIDSIKRMIFDIKKEAFDFSKRTTMQIALRPMGAHPLFYWWEHSDAYPLTSKSGTAYASQTEFQDASAVQAKLCIQALAFNNQITFQSLCRDTILKSPIDGEPDNNFEYNKILVKSLDNKKLSPQIRVALNHSDRVCAYRDFKRKTMVFYMGITKDQNK